MSKYSGIFQLRRHHRSRSQRHLSLLNFVLVLAPTAKIRLDVEVSKQNEIQTPVAQNDPAVHLAHTEIILDYKCVGHMHISYQRIVSLFNIRNR